MNSVAKPDDFANHVHELIIRVHPSMRLTQPESAHYLWQEGIVGYARAVVVPAGNHVRLTFIHPSPGSVESRPDQVFPYAEISLKAVAQAICDWVDEVKI
jgi:hypothetical protein